jgi:hypothetical protein
MKNIKKPKAVTYTDEPQDEGWSFEGSRKLSGKEERALGIPAPGTRLNLVRKPARPVRINIRMTAETLDGIKARAAEAGMPYQTLASSVLHMVATGRLQLQLAAKGDR